MTSDLSPEAFRALRRGRLGDPYLYVPECRSTQELLRDTALPEGAVAVAEHQTAGRGRLGRTWEDAPRSSLLCSVLLRPGSGVLPQLSLVAALATAEAVEELTGREAQVKWPNDVLVDGRKVAGILLEQAGGAVVAGIGVNVGQERGELTEVTGRRPARCARRAAVRTTAGCCWRSCWSGSRVATTPGRRGASPPSGPRFRRATRSEASGCRSGTWAGSPPRSPRAAGSRSWCPQADGRGRERRGRGRRGVDVDE